MTVLPAEIRSFLDATRAHGSGLTILDFGGGSGELVGTACRAHDQQVILDPVRDPSTAQLPRGSAFDALIFSHVLPFIADPLALFAELAAYRHPDARSLAIVLDDTGTQAEICREAANSDPHFLHYFGHAQRLESLLDSAGIPFSSHTVVTRAVARSHDSRPRSLPSPQATTSSPRTTASSHGGRLTASSGKALSCRFDREAAAEQCAASDGKL